MKIGLVTFPTDESIRPDVLAIEAEKRGFSSLFFTEHSNIPASRETPYPGGDELPPEYYRTYDPFVALSFAASATTELRIGTGMCVLVQRDPIHTAKSVVSLDHLSRGRFDFGIAAGWNVDEMRQHGTNPGTRTKLLRERVLAMKELWAKDLAEYHGQLVDIAPTTLRPAPLQRPHPPILLGGMGPTVLDRVLDYADAWCPNPGWPAMPDLPDRLQELRDRSRTSGRGHIPVYIFGVTGGAEQADVYREWGVDESVFLLPTLPQDETIAALDELASAVL
ncbi:LLM class F420-dependent oxidoreductase [Subtercola boreus]|uniref:LLM class F420-dependent oxidoreductase n=1 Tax=Subtercola boreus TaxID=120213 RepID=A0A3E0VI48_9MICO|nr:LLM class F420-dependent oxidoreductase [Subtercola boreus]RFA08537.1 LLM class F420-dependent oxidoreductase [Subtercola boreus]TQL54534.1 putative F420-dependent oxidoreductase [Subtercola boreus]